MTLRALARSLPVTAAALAAICNAGCALPRVEPRMSNDFASGATRVRSIAVLPVDLRVAIADQHPGSPETVFLDGSMLERVHRGLAAALARRGYQVSAVIEPSGASHDPRRGWRMVFHPKDLAALRVEIHNSTTPFAPGPGLIETRVSADLTRALGAATGAEATLYARGWAYVAPRQSHGSTVAKVLIGILMVLIIVGLVMALFGSKGKSKGHPGGHSSGGHHHSTRRVTRLPGYVALRTVSTLAHIAAHATTPCYSCPPPPPPPPLPPTHEAGLDEPRFAEPPPASHPAASRPAAPPRPEPAPMVHLRSGPEPTGDEVGLAISLLENRSGRVLWHAAQRFAVRAGPDLNVERLVDHFLTSLPPAR